MFNSKGSPSIAHTSRISRSAFTLVELIVVIVILAILATIAFLSFSSQSGSARDSTRLSDIASIKKGVEMYNVDSGSYPSPDTPVSVTYSGGIAWSQGKLGDKAYNLISKTLSKKVKDPLKDTEYDYSLASNKREYQVAGNMENPTGMDRNHYNPFASLSETINTNALGGTGMNVHISGNYNGVVLKVQSGSISFYVPTPTLFGNFSAGSDTVSYDSSFSSGKVIMPGINNYASFDSNQIYAVRGTNISSSGVIKMMQTLISAYTGSNVNTPSVLQLLSADSESLDDLGSGLVKNSLGGEIAEISFDGTTGDNAGTSCSSIRSSFPDSADGLYWVDPDDLGPAEPFKVYCDMAGGGWTLVAVGEAKKTNELSPGNNATGTLISPLQIKHARLALGVWNQLGSIVKWKSGGTVFYSKHGSQAITTSGWSGGYEGEPRPSCSTNGTTWANGRGYHIADCYISLYSQTVYGMYWNQVGNGGTGDATALYVLNTAGGTAWVK